MSINGKIAELVLRTQNASDGGKHKAYFVVGRRPGRDNCAGYPQKDRLLITTLGLIARGGSNWKYAVVPCRQYANPAYIVYFETRIAGEKVQVSFHSFNRELSRYTRNSFRIKWDEKDSRDSAVRAYRHYCPNGQYSELY